MPRVITESCQLCKYADCVEICPVNCFFEQEDMLVINPEECIDCEACDPECPVSAIVPEDEAPLEWITKNSNGNWDEKYRRTTKDQVTPGPNRDPNIG